MIPGAAGTHRKVSLDSLYPRWRHLAIAVVRIVPEKFGAVDHAGVTTKERFARIAVR
jgi:hypothetical protein